METKLWYSIQNGGDGSAYPIFMECKEQAELNQKHMDEGWAEDCSSFIIIKSEGEITCNAIQTIDEEIKEIEEDLEDALSENYIKYKTEHLTELKKLKEVRNGRTTRE